MLLNFFSKHSVFQHLPTDTLIRRKGNFVYLNLFESHFFFFKCILSWWIKTAVTEMFSINLLFCVGILCYSVLSQVQTVPSFHQIEKNEKFEL